MLPLQIFNERGLLRTFPTEKLKLITIIRLLKVFKRQQFSLDHGEKK